MIKKNEFDVENAITEGSTRNTKNLKNINEKVNKLRCNNKFMNEFSPNVTNMEDFNENDKDKLLLIEIEEKIRNCAKLTLVVLDSKFYKKYTEIAINCIGLEKEDVSEYLEKIKQENLGYTFFGCSAALMLSPKSGQMKKNYTRTSENKDYSDILSVLNGQLNNTNLNLTNLNCKLDYDLNVADKINELHFYIKYDYLSGNYLAKKVRTSAFFKKIDSKQEIGSKTIIDFGSNQIITKVEKQENFNKITLVVSFGVNEGKIYEFNSNEKTVVKIGRKQYEGIDIVFADEACSRLQCSIFYENQNWYIVDSDGKTKSSNGTWILVSEESIIYNNSIYRAGNFIFEAKLTIPNFIEDLNINNELNEKVLNNSVINANNEEQNDQIEEIANR